MKKWMIAIAAAIFSIGVFAQAPASTEQPFKMGVVDVRQVLQKSQPGMEAQKKLQAEMTEQQKQVQAAAQQFQANVAKLNRDSAVMTEKDRTALTKKLQDEQKKLNELRMNLQRNFYEKQNTVLQTLVNQLNGVVAQIAKKKGLTLILNKEAVVYGSDDADITNEVISEMK